VCLTAIASRERGLVESILDASPYGIIVSDAHGKLRLQNKAAKRIWAGSATASDIAEWGKYRGFHSDGRPYEGGDWAMARCLLGGETVEPAETHILRFDNSHGVLLGGAAPIRSGDGELVGAVSIFADVTKMKQTEEAPRLSSERFFTTLRSIGDAVIATDAQGRVNFLNPIAEHLTLWTVDEAKGRALGEVFRIGKRAYPVASREPRREGAARGQDRRHGEPHGADRKARCRGRHRRQWSTHFGEQGDLAGVVLVFRDVTEPRREENRRRFLNEASTLLASSLEYGPTLTSVTRLAVPIIADWCAVDIVERGGNVARLAVAHVNPAKVRFAEELEARYPSNPASPRRPTGFTRL